MMNRANFITKLVASILTCAAIGLFNTQMVLARPIPVTSLRCQNAMGNSSGVWTESKEDVTLSREIYTSLVLLYSDSAFSCKLPAAQKAKLNLEAGIPSAEGGPVKLDFYLNGFQVYSDKIYPGRVTQINVSLTGRSDVTYTVEGRRTLSVETTCLSGGGCSRIYIRLFKADLEVEGSPGSRDK